MKGLTKVKTALSIAGSDSSGGAGIQADIKTMTVNGVYAMSAITALTAQNTTGVYSVLDVTPDFLKAQLDAVFTDIFPDAVKIGMVSSSALIETIAQTLIFYNAKNIIIDPVMIATSGATLTKANAINALQEKLFPLATLITPNIPEAETLTEMKIYCSRDMELSAQHLGRKYGCAVLLKGGHSINDANDLFWHNGDTKWFSGKRINTVNTHGTGCTLSSAIAANLAKGMPLIQSIENAKNYVTNALDCNLNLGHGNGPLNHGFVIN